MDSDAGVHVDMAGSDWEIVQNERGMKPSLVTAFVMDTGIGAARTQKAVSQCHQCSSALAADADLLLHLGSWIAL